MEMELALRYGIPPWLLYIIVLAYRSCFTRAALHQRLVLYGGCGAASTAVYKGANGMEGDGPCDRWGGKYSLGIASFR